MIQRLIKATSGIVKNDGTVVLKFEQIPQSLCWTGTLSVTNATGSEKWTANVGIGSSNDQAWGQFFGASQFGPIQAISSEVLSISASGLTPGVIYNASFIGTSSDVGEVPFVSPQPQPLTLSQIAATVQASVTGAVTANQPQVQLTGSPLTVSGPGTTTFTWPVNSGPFSCVLLTLSAISGGVSVDFPVNLTVSGATTLTPYLAEVVDHGVWRLDISSLVEPDGVTVDYQLPYGYVPAFWTPTFNLVGMVTPEIVRPAYGPGDSGPTLWAENVVYTGGPTSVALAGGGRTSTLRLWGAFITMDAIANANVVEFGSYITYPGGIILSCIISTGNNVPVNNGVSISIPGGLPIPIGSTIAPLSLAIDAPVVPGHARGGIYYSWDSQ